jgi:RimJ/RimL family protein N-acetyltransferase
MAWEIPSSYEAYKSRWANISKSADLDEIRFVVRIKEKNECLGVVGLEKSQTLTPELGIWLKETAHGQGYGYEAVLSVVNWASASFKFDSFIYPVAIQNTASRRIAEKLGGKIFQERKGSKYDSVVYKIPVAT